jgi:hypothetical protein
MMVRHDAVGVTETSLRHVLLEGKEAKFVEFLARYRPVNLAWITYGGAWNGNSMHPRI